MHHKARILGLLIIAYSLKLSVVKSVAFTSIMQAACISGPEGEQNQCMLWENCTSAADPTLWTHQEQAAFLLYF